MKIKSNGSHLLPAKTHGNKYYNQSTELLFYSNNEGNDMIVNVLYCRLHCKMTKHPRKSSVVQHLPLRSISEMHFESNAERQNPVDLNTLKSSSIPSPAVSTLCRIAYAAQAILCLDFPFVLPCQTSTISPEKWRRKKFRCLTGNSSLGYLFDKI